MDFRWLLRDRTGAAHARLDATIGQFNDSDGYGRYVGALYRFRAPVEEALAGLSWPERFGSYRPALLAPALQGDLDDLGLASPPCGGARLDLGGAGLLGTLYVLEGAALGARVLIQRACALGYSAGYGARHLALAATGASWPAFPELIRGTYGIDQERATAAALATFALAQRSFEGSPA